MDARTRRKMRRQTERELTAQGVDTDTYWYSYLAPKKEKEPERIPGKDFYAEAPEYQEKIDNNRWDRNFNEVVETIKELVKKDSEWSWTKNWDCKCVNIRIDMRDGGFVLVDQHGKRVSLDAIKWQWSDKDV